MRPVRDSDGDTVLIVESDPAVVYDPRTGERRRVPAADLDPVEGDPLAAAGRAVPAADRSLPPAARGLLADLAVAPRSVRGMLDAYGRCESDLHGLLAELRAAGLIAETEVGGERGYRLTDEARAALP